MKRAIPVYYGISLAWRLCSSCVWSQILYYQLEIVHLKPVQMLLLGTIAEIAIFLCEVPTGVIADLKSRKLSVILGFFVLGIGMAIQGIWPTLPVSAGGMILWGIGGTLLSGAYEAWIVDELPHEGSGVPTAESMFVRGAQFGYVGTLLGICLGGGLALIHLRWPVIVGGLLYLVLALVLCALMPERGFHRATEIERSTWQHMVAILKDGLKAARASVLVRACLWVTFLAGFASEAFDRLWNVHFASGIGLPDTLPPPLTFALLQIVAMLVAVTVLYLVRRKGLEQQGPSTIRALVVMNVLVALGLGLFAGAKLFAWGAAFFVLARSVRESIEPLLTGWLNRYAEPKFRATLLSFAGQAHGIGEVCAGPVLGGLATIGVAISLQTSALITLGAATLCVWSYRYAMRSSTS